MTRDSLWIVMEYRGGGSVSDIVKTLNAISKKRQMMEERRCAHQSIMALCIGNLRLLASCLSAAQ